MKLNKIISAAVSLAVAAPLVSSFTLSPVSAAINAQSVTLYSLNSSYEQYLSIPDDEPTSFQLEVDEGTIKSARVISGKSVTVTSDGLIEPSYTIWYWNGGIGSTTSWGVENETVEKTPNLGKSVVRVTDSLNNVYDVEVSVEEYSTFYADNIIRQYLNENIKDDMTTKEIMNTVAKMPAMYDYSPYASGYVSMIITNGGDCWASTALIRKELDMLGIKNWSRNGNRDSGSGSGHMNAMAEVDGVYYELEAGYTGKAPRAYHVKERSSLFCFRSVTGGMEVYQYDGNDDDMKTLEVPSEYGGKPVIGIGESFVSSDSRFEEVILPEGITYIKDYAFGLMDNLKKINIPSTVTKIGAGAFLCDEALTQITVSEDSQSFTAVDNTIYSKDMTTLVFLPLSASEFKVPDTVSVIGAEAVRYNENIERAFISGNIKTIGVASFYGCKNLVEVTIDDGVKEICDYAFTYTPELKSIVIPESVEKIGECAIGYNRSGKVIEDFVIYGFEGSAAQAYAEKNNIKFEIYSDEINYGDANCDGSVTIADAVFIMQCNALPSKYVLSLQGAKNADVYNTGDGVTNRDALSIQRYLLGFIGSLPEPLSENTTLESTINIPEGVVI